VNGSVYSPLGVHWMEIFGEVPMVMIEILGLLVDHVIGYHGQINRIERAIIRRVNWPGKRSFDV